MALNILGLKFMLLLGPLDPAKFPVMHPREASAGVDRRVVSCVDPLDHNELGGRKGA